MKKFDVIVVGAGHAGCEAAIAAAKLGSRTLLITTNLEKVATLPCNPSVGGPGKGHLVREIGALGGVMAKVTDAAAIQMKELNTSKGPAVRAYRAQVEQGTYNATMLAELKATKNLEFYIDEVKEVLADSVGSAQSAVRTTETADSRLQTVRGVKTADGTEILADAVIICTGTFMTGQIVVGNRVVRDGGRMDEKASLGLTDSLNSLGLVHGRLKTGTPPRLDKHTIDYSVMSVVEGTPGPVSFSYPGTELMAFEDQIPCHLGYTNPTTHKMIMDNLDKTPIFSGFIKERAPRSCPSLDRKVVNFPERDRHPIFIEPTGRHDQKMYIQGGSLAFEEDLQEKIIRTIAGLEEVKFLAHGYAVVYDFFPPHQIKNSLETKVCKGLYLAGQMNGTTGYEEAAAQGLMAGINAARAVQGLESVILRRDQAYIGVLIDDLVTKVHVEPYRMFTSRAEYRLLLRNDNADLRLSQLGHEIGLVSTEFITYVKQKESLLNNSIIQSKNLKNMVENRTISAYEFLARPATTTAEARTIFGLDSLPPEVDDLLTLEAKYSGYFEKEAKLAQKLEDEGAQIIAPTIDYDTINGLRNEARVRLKEVTPATIGQAGRIQGVTPADLSIVMVHNRKALAGAAS